MTRRGLKYSDLQQNHIQDRGDTMITRSKETIDATVNGQQTKLALCLKDGYAMAYWYWIQFPCGGWREFDLRQACDNPPYWTGRDWRRRLNQVASLIADKNVFDVALQAA